MRIPATARPSPKHRGAGLARRYAELNVAKAKDLVKAEVLLSSTEDGGPMGSLSLSLRCATAIKPFVAVRKAFSAKDANGDGARPEPRTPCAQIPMRSAPSASD